MTTALTRKALLSLLAAAAGASRSRPRRWLNPMVATTVAAMARPITAAGTVPA